MYNHQLDTFLKCADTASFSQAAKQLYVTPSAVIQQINTLENNLNVKLFSRTNKGLHLTAAGEYLYHEAEHIISWDSTLKSRLLELSSQNAAIHVAMPILHRSTAFYELWTLYSSLHPEVKIQFIQSSSADSKEIFKTYSNADIVEFPDTGDTWQKEKKFLKLGEYPVVAGIPDTSPLSRLSVITPKSLAGETVVISETGFSGQIQQAAGILESYGAHLEYVRNYSSPVTAQCIVDKKILLFLSCSAHIHPALHTVRLTWNIQMDYGFFYESKSDNPVLPFIAFVKEQISSGNFKLPE